MQQSDKEYGVVYLVGAGPGDPGLITRAGARALAEADVLVFDALVNPLLLDLAPAQAKRIDVGKRGGQHKKTQGQINHLLVEQAHAGHTVVRLKGGDPYLFGRGAEEAACLARHGVRVVVLPGVTAGIAAPALAGIPVTHRAAASVLTFVTGHEDPAKNDTAIDYQALAALITKGGTVCFYMGVGRLQTIACTLQSHGLSEDTPAAIIQWGTLPIQRSIRTTLSAAAGDCARAGLGSPAIIVVGRVAGLDEPGLDWFTDRPLFGQHIVITRTRQQASELSRKLRDQGAMVYEAPTIEIVPPGDWSAADQQVRRLSDYDWLVLTSSNGVASLVARLRACAMDARDLAGVRLAAIGDATARAIEQQLAIRPDFIPTRFVAESLASELLAKEDVHGKRFLLWRADIARPALPKRLAEAGAEVTECVAYSTRSAPSLPEDVLQALRQGTIDWVTFTSSSTVRNMASLLGTEKQLLERVKIASIGPVTTDAIQALGFEPVVQAEVSNIDGLIDAIAHGAAEAEV